MREKHWAEQCAAAGLRLTGQRKTILGVLAESHDHPSVESVYERARTRDSAISMATVYRTLNALHELDLVIRHDFKDESGGRFELNHAHHHHLIDVEKGDVIEFEDEAIEKQFHEIAERLGYSLLDHTLELYGRRK
mgnify:CR=1 FL=1